MRPLPPRLAHALLALVLCCVALPTRAATDPTLGYYRQPSIRGDVVVFAAEGDIWRVASSGGVATRLTTHPGVEATPALSFDGKWLAFTGQYEGPTEVYVMPLAGGVPERCTYDAALRTAVVGWTPDGRILYATDAASTLPNTQLATYDPATHVREMIPLAQAADGSYGANGTLYFTRFPFNGSFTKQYHGGMAQVIWRYDGGATEAVPLTSSFAGTSRLPMCLNDRIYFLSDRDSTINLCSMRLDGGDVRQHTHHAGWDIQSAALGDGRIVYQLGADLRLYDIAREEDRALPITLASDFDQMRERWIAEPMEYLTSAHVSPDGAAVALTARGRVFVAPRGVGRFVDVTQQNAHAARFRDARFLPDGRSLVALSDESGEVELWKLPANGAGERTALTHDATVLRWETAPSPDGRWIAHHDKNQRLWLLDARTRANRLVDSSAVDVFEDLRWSPDGQWLAYVARAANNQRQIRICRASDRLIVPVTTDRFNSLSPAWSADCRWLYFLSDRALESVVDDVWGAYQPEPFLDNSEKIYALALVPGLRSPFHAPDELARAATEAQAAAASATNRPPPPPRVTVTPTGLRERLIEVPVPPGNYSSLMATGGALLWLEDNPDDDAFSLVGVPITNDPDSLEVRTVLDGVSSAELSMDAEHVLVRKDDDLLVLDAAPEAVDKDALDRFLVSLDAWRLSLDPREEWRQMFDEAWRLARDYFYDPGMHGADWAAIRRRYAPLVDRVRTRGDLDNILAQMVSELSALHSYVYGADLREGPDDVEPASLGARLERATVRGASVARVAHVYRSDPDRPDMRSPLADPVADVREGDAIVAVNGTPVASVSDVGQLLRDAAGRQVLLRLAPAGGRPARDAIVTPIPADSARDLRYSEWEYTRRTRVEERGRGDIGYVHLRAMGGSDYAAWAANFYPVFTRQGLIVDVRNNRGGNIDSWILEKLLRKAWAYWSQRVGAAPSWNMQYAFRGHLVVLCNERTVSDGELFCEGIKRLHLGTVIGTRTLGGEIWLTSSNVLVDRGIATAAEYGVFGPEGQWIIEGHGVDPDVVVDNPPHATFAGEDAQLDAAIAYLQKEIRAHPVPPPPQPKYPIKAVPGR